MKNILIATDFSKEAYCALYYATRLFQEENTTFYIANFFGDKIHASVYSIINEEEFGKIPKLKQDSEIASKEIFHHIVRDTGLSGERFQLISSEKKLVKGIEDLIQSHNIDLVVMGTKSHKGTLNSIAGTNTTRVIEKAFNVPVLIVPRELEFNPPMHIAFASELIFDFNFEALGIVREIAKKFKAEITVIHDGEEIEVSRRQWEHYNSLKSYFKGIPVTIEFSSTHIEISRSIAEFIKNNKVDMLCMEYYKHSGPGKLFREPVVEKIDRHLSFPFLILPAKS
ncbi:universal stress protein [Gramella sp. MT6]|uniref:universal stress protein n=1 Tax=Gramella sp. MT6 TaxID=2705471 RepID=UPI001C5CCA49|nr:universal stress protein [Gramella sp. MT6]QYA24271.1 universal stress protein [Gramella sp. MT6]